MEAVREYYAHFPDTLPLTLIVRKALPILQYLEEVEFPRLLAQDTRKLDAPITPSELIAVVKELSKGKSLDPDDFNNYSKFLPHISSLMYSYFNALAKGSCMPWESLLAYVTVLSKDEKDHTLPCNCRTISLLNTDIKILA